MKSDFNLARSGTLAELPVGAEAVVVAVDGEGPSGRRLQDLGLLPNTVVRHLRKAPLGDPSLYELRGYRLCLRRADAVSVRVRPCAPDAGPTLP